MNEEGLCDDSTIEVFRAYKSKLGLKDPTAEMLQKSEQAVQAYVTMRKAGDSTTIQRAEARSKIQQAGLANVEAEARQFCKV